MSSREAARATRSMLSCSAAAGILRPGSASGWGRFGKSSTGSTRRWKLEPPLRISTSCSAARSSISTLGSGSERATSAKRRPGSSTAPASSTVGLEGRLQAEVEIGGGEGDAAVLGSEQDAGERLGGGAGGNGPGDDRELGDEIFAFGRELQVGVPLILVFLSWVRSCGKKLRSRRIRRGTGICGVWKGLWEAGDSCSAGGCQRSLPTGLWIAPRNSRTFSASSASSSRLASTRRSELSTVVWSRPP